MRSYKQASKKKKSLLPTSYPPSSLPRESNSSCTFLETSYAYISTYTDPLVWARWYRFVVLWPSLLSMTKSLGDNSRDN